MLELYDKLTEKKITIYATSEDSNGYPKFLIRLDNQWVWKSAKHYITKDEIIESQYNEGYWNSFELSRGLR